MELATIAIAMECLFPKGEEGALKCCDEKWKRSCNPGLAKTVHKYDLGRSKLHLNLYYRFINNGDNGQKFVKEFQPQISSKVGAIIQNFLNRY